MNATRRKAAGHSGGDGARPSAEPGAGPGPAPAPAPSTDPNAARTHPGPLAGNPDATGTAAAAPATGAAARLTPPSPSQVLAVLDDAAAGAALLEMSSTLARALQRELSVVYVESARSLVAAALPFTQVLAHAGRKWIPLQPQDVERGFRADEARLRELAARFALRDAVSWSLRVRRGSLLDTAFELVTESDLLLTLPSAPLAVPRDRTRQPARRRPIVTVLALGGDRPESDRRMREVAAQLTQALGGVVEIARLASADEFVRRVAVGDLVPRPDVLVLPRDRLLPGVLAWLRCPVVLVG